jgi:hypothetical protein
VEVRQVIHTRVLETLREEDAADASTETPLSFIDRGRLISGLPEALPRRLQRRASWNLLFIDAVDLEEKSVDSAERLCPFPFPVDDMSDMTYRLGK